MVKLKIRGNYFYLFVYR